jgi:integrase
LKVLNFFNKKEIKENSNQISKKQILNNFKNILEKNFSHDTAKTYFSSLNCALKNQEFTSKDELKWDLIIEHTLTLKNRNQVSKLKNALKHFDHDNYIFHRDNLNKIHLSKWKAKRKLHETFMLDQTLKRINNIRNDKLKIGFRLMLLTGIRVQELSNLKKSDIKFEKTSNRKNSKEKYQVTVIRGKGGKTRSIFGIRDAFVQDKLKELINNCKKDDDKVFYSANYMQQTATKLIFIATS